MTSPNLYGAVMLTKHEIALTVNRLRDIAKEYGQTQQLRERIAAVVVPLLSASKPATPVAICDEREALSKSDMIELYHIAREKPKGEWMHIVRAMLAAAPAATAQSGVALTDADLSDLYSFAKGEPRPEWIDHAKEFIAARAPSAVVLDDERAAFEAAVQILASRDGDEFEHQYDDDELDAFWAVWRIARAASPQAAATQADALDAKRYRWLRDWKADPSDFCCASLEIYLPVPARDKTEAPRKHSACFDAAIDAAMTDSQPASGGAGCQ
jgi:hypothetical protein